MDWLEYTDRVTFLERKLSPLRIVRGESQGLSVARLLEGQMGGYWVAPGANNLIWLSDGTCMDVRSC